MCGVTKRNEKCRGAGVGTFVPGRTAISCWPPFALWPLTPPPAPGRMGPGWGVFSVCCVFGVLWVDVGWQKVELCMDVWGLTGCSSENRGRLWIGCVHQELRGERSGQKTKRLFKFCSVRTLLTHDVYLNFWWWAKRMWGLEKIHTSHKELWSVLWSTEEKMFSPCDNPACVTDHCSCSLRPLSEFNW